LIFRDDMKFHANRFDRTSAHILIGSFLFAGIAALLVGIQQSLQKAEASIRPALKVLVFVQPNYPDDDARRWVDSLAGQDASIESTLFVSREEALAKAQANPALAKSLMLLNDNPFPASVFIRYKDEAWLDRPEPAAIIRDQPPVEEIRWDPASRSAFRTIRQWRLWLFRFDEVAAVIFRCGA